MRSITSLITMITTFETKPSQIIIPDLVAHCDFKISLNIFVDRAALQSKEWLFAHGNLTQKSKDTFIGLKAGELASLCYPLADLERLRVCCDFSNYLFHMDDLSDDMDNAGTEGMCNEVMNTLYHPYLYQPTTRLGKMTADYWKRFIKTGSPGAQQRFMSSFDQWFHSVTVENIDRNQVPTLESYIMERRDTSGCKLCWALIEYANNLDIPDEVIEHPIIRNLEDAANDLIGWSNDIFSYKREQRKGHTRNIIHVVMEEHGLDLQSAVDFVGTLCKQTIDRFKEDMNMLPSWGPEIDDQVQAYVDGLIAWIVGTLHWSFDSERYFGKFGPQVKATRVVYL